jgi:hypothetical protein
LPGVQAESVSHEQPAGEETWLRECPQRVPVLDVRRPVAVQPFREPSRPLRPSPLPALRQQPIRMCHETVAVLELRINGSQPLT